MGCEAPARLPAGGGVELCTTGFEDSQPVAAR